MADNTESSSGVIEELTPEELKILSKALKRVESDIFNRLLKRLSVLVGVAISVLLIGGLVNLSSCSSNVENNASQKLASDPELRDKVVDKAQKTLTEVQEKLKVLNDETAELERRNAQGAATFMGDLVRIRGMVEQINKELASRLPPANDKSLTPEKK